MRRPLAAHVVAALALACAAQASSAADLVVEWAPLAVAVDAYQIERRLDGGGADFAPIARVSAGARSFTDRGVTAGARYCYRVRGVRGARRSPPSPPLCNVAAERAGGAALPSSAQLDPPSQGSAAGDAIPRTDAAAEAAMAAPAPETARGAPSEPMATPDTASLQGAADDVTPTSSVADAASRETAAAVVEPPPAAARLPATPAAAQPDTAARPPESAFGETREVKALRRPPPAYPREAQIRGLSGWVRLRFTVTAAGTTRDARVVAADPPGVFDQAALDAAQRFVYSPRLENGVAVDRENVETEVTFTWIERGGDLITGRRDPVPR